VQSPGPLVFRPRKTAWILVLVGGCAAGARDHRAAIVVSLDALNEQRLLGSVSSEWIPAFHRLFRESACADGARPHFPAVTAPSHASIWTGAWGTVHGVTGSLVPPADTRLDSLVDGFSFAQLNAEPLWIAAARQGLTVVGHHVTHAPGVPGYPRRPEVERRQLQHDARRALDRVGTAVLNGYNRRVAGATALSHRTHRFRPGPPWAGDSGKTGARELAVAVGADSLFFRVVPGDARLLVAPKREVAQAVEVPVVPEDTTSARGRSLARFFAPPVSWRLADSTRVYVRVRAFHLSPDAREFLVAIPEIRAVEANTPSVAASYAAESPAWVGNVPFHLWRDGLLGDTLTDQKAEWRLLELAELATDGFLRGTTWALRRKPQLLLDYFSLGDDIDHALYGRSNPRARVLRARLWELVDLRLAALMDAASGTPGTMLLVTGDHGMRVADRTWHVNTTLQRAGFLRTDANGRVQLDRTTALSPTGYWITVNDVRRPAGIVAVADRARLLDSLERTLLGLRDEHGRAVVTRTFREGTVEGDTLGLGGENGGDLYYDVADGIMWSARLGPEEFVTRRAGGEHGYPSVSPEMRTVVCAFGPDVKSKRTPTARLIDIAPTVSEWLGISPPTNSRGHSLLGAWGQQP
jgi:predicted AlkP superfamily phosphohydrolase/phosphomutase